MPTSERTDPGRASRELSLSEYIDKLRDGQPRHRAVREYDALVRPTPHEAAPEASCEMDAGRCRTHPTCEGVAEFIEALERACERHQDG